MTKRNIIIIVLVCVLIGLYTTFKLLSRSNFNPNPKYTIGQPLDSLNGVLVYYNGMVGHSDGRTTDSGYNIGIKYQCVEFVKRYYYQRFHHKMPDAFGNAQEFFDSKLPDSTYNTKRALMQFSNGSRCKPQPEDLIIFDRHAGNIYGHVAIIAETTDSNITIIQQNPGPFAASRDTIGLQHNNNLWTVNRARTLGWLRRDTLWRDELPNNSQ